MAAANSVTRFNDFVKFLVTNFHTKVAQMYVDMLDRFESIHFHE